MEPQGARSWWLDAGPEPASPLTPDRLTVGGAGLDLARVDVVVVGAGASGLEAAVLLAERGADVAVLDAVGVAGGAAGANGGFLLAGLADFHHDAVARHGRRAALAWWHRTAEEIDRIVADQPSATQHGSLRVAASSQEEADIAAQLTAMRRDGLAAEPYEGVEGTGLLVPGDAAIDPAARCRRLADRAVAAGARIVAPAPVTAIAPGAVTAAGITVRCRWVLVCVDGGLEWLSLPDGARLPRRVRTARLEMLATAPTREVQLRRPVYRRDGLDYLQQRPTGEVLLGGGRDVADAWAPPEAGVATPTPQVQGHLDDLLATLGLTVEVTHRWAAWAAFTDDRLPIAAEVAPGVHVLGGYSGHGNVIGGMLAREVAAALLS